MSEQFLADRVLTLKPSGIRRFFDLAASMDGVISLGVGEPDFVTSWRVREACIQSLEQGFTSYTANAGMTELKDEISLYLNGKYNIHYNPESEVLVTVGASQAIDLALRAIVNPGDEIIIVEPSFVAYGPTVTLAGGIPIPIQTLPEQQFKLQPEQIEDVITTRTKAIMICSPNNPTGTVLNEDELTNIAEIAERHNLLILSDEIYAELCYDEPHTSFASLPAMRERTILLSGFSKGFAMTGWRIGYAAAPKPILQAMLKIHQYAMMCAPTMAQFAALEALKNGKKDAEKMRNEYRHRRNYFVESMNEIGLPCHLPGGAFYAFPSITRTGFTSEEFAEHLLKEEKVAVVPGSVFGASGEGHIRCSYASSMEQLQEAVFRIDRFVNRLR
jgi:aminotransferase